eukprot:TRINITY_DN63729_c0_g1_i1.p1 TRINITY_DN63729_c0_g1~~TRINITY_DN63729_c0_g1_i1.p1  ORF type:complete len:1612 (+),score=289.69 TRINITY_DN63729_c0_g1_i1:676-4836(+)
MAYAAPEAFTGLYGPAVDVWAAGVILYIMLTGNPPPFNPENLEDPPSMMPNLVKLAVAEQKLQLAPGDCSVDLLRHLLTVDDKCRPTAKELLRLPWLSKDGTKPGLRREQTSSFADTVAQIGKSRMFQTTIQCRPPWEPFHARSFNAMSPITEISTEMSPKRNAGKDEADVAGLRSLMMESSPWMLCALITSGVLAVFRSTKTNAQLGRFLLDKCNSTWAGTFISTLSALLLVPALRKSLRAEMQVLPQDGPEALVIKARRIRHPRVREQLLGEVRMLAKQEFALSRKDYQECVTDMELALDKQLVKEGGRVALGAHAPPVPFLGGFHLLSGVFWRDCQMLRQRYGKAVLIRLLSKNIFFIMDAEMMEEVLNKRPHLAPHQTSFNLQLEQRLGGSDLAFVDMGQAWRRRRKATQAAFVQQIPNIAQHAVAEAQRLCARIANELPYIFSTGECDIMREFRDILIQTVASALYGTRLNTQDLDTLDTCMVKMFQVAAQLDPYDFHDFFERLPPHVWYKKEMDQIMTDIMAVHRPHFERIRKNFDPRAKSTNVLEEYLKLQGGDATVSLSDFEVLTMMHNIFSAAVDSTSVSGPWTIAFLINNPKKLAQLREEIDTVTDGGTRWMCREDLQRTPFLASCFKESVRMRPPFPVLTRVTGNEGTEICGYTLPPFTQLVMGVAVVNNLEENFTNASSWSPERWLDEGGKLYPRKLRVFGGGMRICPGAQLAFENVQLLLGSLVQNYDIEGLAGLPNLDLTGNALSIPPQHFKLKVTVRRSSLIARSHTAITNLMPQLEQAASVGAGNNKSLVKKSKSSAQDSDQVRVFYCSSTGVAEQFALSMKGAAGLNVSVMNLADFDETLPTDAPCIFITSTYYNGEPPDTGRAFHKWLAAQPDEKLKGLKFAVFANGNSQYEHYNWMGKEVDKHLSRLGGERIVDLGLGDASEDAETAWDQWNAGLMAVLKPQATETQVLDKVDPTCDWTIKWLDGSAAGSKTRIRRADSQKLSSVEIQKRTELRKDTSEGSCLELMFSLNNMKYETAENLMLYPENSAELVEQMAQQLTPPCTEDLDRTFTLEWNGDGPEPEPPVSLPTTLRQVLTRECDLTSKPKKSVLRELSAFAMDLYEREALRVLLSPKWVEWFELKTAKGMNMVDFLTEYPSIKLPVESLLTLLPSLRMQPRRYTISSSPLADPSKMRLTVTMHEKLLLGGKVFNGLCTHWLRDMPLGSPCRATVQPSGFVPPKDPSTPIIMVGAGSGIAPLIAFAEMREAQKLQGKALGPAIFFFGCRHPDRDFIYRDRLEAWARSGVISEIVVAFSRPSSGCKRYVQHMVAERGEDLAKLFQAGAQFFICGATAMGLSVRDALISGRALTDLAEVKALEEQGRYVQELWS